MLRNSMPTRRPCNDHRPAVEIEDLVMAQMAEPFRSAAAPSSTPFEHAKCFTFHSMNNYIRYDN